MASDQGWERMSKDAKILDRANRDSKIIMLAISGVPTKQIADDVGISYNRADQIVEDALNLALEHYSEAAVQLFAKNYMRIDGLINRLLIRLEATPYGEDMNLSAIDRVDRLVNTQIKMLSRDNRIRANDDPDKPTLMRSVFPVQSVEYDRALELANADPDYNPEDEIEKLENAGRKQDEEV